MADGLYKTERLTMTIEEVSYALGIGINTARNLVHSKGFPMIKVGRRIVIPTKKFHEWLNNSTGQAFAIN